MLAILIANSAAIATEALEKQTRYRVQEIIPLLNASLASPLVERDYATLDEILAQAVRKGGIEYLAVTDEEGRLVANQGERPEAYGQEAETGFSDINDVAGFGQIEVPITLVGQTVGRLHLSINTGFLQATISTLEHEGLLIAGGEVVITFILLALLGMLLTRNLAILASAARSMTGGDLRARVNIDSRDEIGATARAFNAMAARLDASYNSLKRSERRYQTLAEVSPVGIFNTDAEGQCIYVNERYSDITGLPQERCFGFGWSETLHPDDRELVMREWEYCAASGIPYVGEYRICNARSEVVWVYVQAVKSDVMDGGYVGTVTDITRLKAVEEELARHRDSLEGLVKARTRELEAAQDKLLRQERLATLGQLTATVSHELRNPLGVISNAVYFLKRKCQGADDELDAKVDQYLEMIKREIAAADRIISDLLATSRTKDPVVQWVNLDELLEAIVSAGVFPDHIQWRYDREPRPFMMRADPTQLTQVLRNLIGNAIQAITASGNGQGVVSLVAREENGHYQLCVCDSGPGVELAARKKIFEPLYTTRAKGNGLGLWISREIIRVHGGELSCAEHNCDSNLSGAAFMLVLPRGNAREKALAESA